LAKDVGDEGVFAAGVGFAIVRMFVGEILLERCIGLRGVGVGGEVIPEQNDRGGAIGGADVNVVSAAGAERGHAFDEKQVPRVGVGVPENVAGGG